MGGHLKPRILIYSGSGTVSMDYFVPIIPDLGQDWAIDYLEADEARSASADNWISQYLKNGSISTFQRVPSQSSQGAWSYQRMIISLLEQIKQKPFKVLLLGTDFYLMDRYLIALARELGAKVVVMHTNLLDPGILLRHLASLGMERNVKKMQLAKPSMAVRLWKKGFSLLRRSFKHARLYVDRYVIPRILWNKVFSVSPYDRFAFTAGRGDVVLFYDTFDASAYQRAVPVLKNAVVTKHPARSPLKTTGGVALDRTKKLLVLFSSYTVEMTEEKMNFWVRVIGQAVAMASLNEVHLRFHPRTRETLVWPARMKEKLASLPVTIKTLPATGASLIEIAREYAGVLGAYSGALRIARAAAPNIFVLGLIGGGEQCSHEGPWVLGNSEGIQWIDETETLRPGHIDVPAPLDENRPTVAEFLKIKEAVAA